MLAAAPDLRTFCALGSLASFGTCSCGLAPSVYLFGPCLPAGLLPEEQCKFDLPARIAIMADRFMQADTDVLEEWVALDSDEEAEDFLLSKYLEKEEELAAAAAYRRRRVFNFDALSNVLATLDFRKVTYVPCVSTWDCRCA